jgi:hypothetical protein
MSDLTERAKRRFEAEKTRATGLYESARRDYGVAINPETWEIDWEETAKLRAA